MSRIHNYIILFLFISIVGFFANWAQNDYGDVIIANCFWAIALLLNRKAHLELKPNKVMYQVYWVTYLLFSVFNGTLSSNSNALDNSYRATFEVLATIILILVILLIFIMPLSALILQIQKWGKQTIVNADNYSESLLLSLFCLGFQLGLNNKIVAFILLAIASFGITLFYFRTAIEGLWQSIKQKNIFVLVNTLICFFLFVFILAFLFKRQHWLGATILKNVGIALFAITLFFLFFHFIRKKHHVKIWWSEQRWLLKTFFIVSVIITSFFLLRGAGLAPDSYSNEYPKAFYELEAHSNNYTNEGRKNEVSRIAYKENYEDFVYNQKEYVIKYNKRKH